MRRCHLPPPFSCWLGCPSAPAGPFEAWSDHPAQASPPRRVMAPGQGADGCLPIATPASPRWPPLGRGLALATRGSRAAAPFSGVQRAVRAPLGGRQGALRYAALPCAAPGPRPSLASAPLSTCVLWWYHASQGSRTTLTQNNTTKCREILRIRKS